jgi:serine/threonine protein kinase
LHTSLDEQNSAVFLKEAQILASLNHPHIIGIHDFTIEQGEPLLRASCCRLPSNGHI